MLSNEMSEQQHNLDQTLFPSKCCANFNQTFRKIWKNKCINLIFHPRLLRLQLIKDKQIKRVKIIDLSEPMVTSGPIKPLQKKRGQRQGIINRAPVQTLTIENDLRTKSVIVFCFYWYTFLN